MRKHSFTSIELHHFFNDVALTHSCMLGVDRDLLLVQEESSMTTATHDYRLLGVKGISSTKGVVA